MIMGQTLIIKFHTYVENEIREFYKEINNTKKIINKK
jgi:hypothetical protein